MAKRPFWISYEQYNWLQLTKKKNNSSEGDCEVDVQIGWRPNWDKIKFLMHNFNLNFNSSMNKFRLKFYDAQFAIIWACSHLRNLSSHMRNTKINSSLDAPRKEWRDWVFVDENEGSERYKTSRKIICFLLFVTTFSLYFS